MKTKLVLFATVLGLMMACSKDENVDPPEPSNNSPVAMAGGDQKVEIGAVVKLNASGSTDPDGDELTYHWSLTAKPEGSIATIMGEDSQKAEFTLDKAGTYEVELKVNDGASEAMDKLMIRTETLALKDVRTQTITGLDDDLVHKGGTISIYGDHFSPDIDDIRVTVGGIPYEITELTMGEDLDLLNTTVPEDAISGDLMVTVGSDSIVWPVPIRIITLPVEAYVNTNQHLEEQIRTPTNHPTRYFEIGTRFKPLVNGSIVGVTLRVPRDGEYEVTLWDGGTKEVLHSEVIVIDDRTNQYALFSDSVPVEGMKEYTVSFNSAFWYQHIDEQDDRANQFPQSFDSALELLSTAYYPGQAKVFPDEGFPVNYITKGADIIFAANVE